MKLKNISKSKYVIGKGLFLLPGESISVNKENAELLAKLSRNFSEDLLVIDENAKIPKIVIKEEKKKNDSSND